jgi:hypothetical protein
MCPMLKFALYLRTQVSDLMYISIDALLEACRPPCDPQFVPMQFDEQARTQPNATCYRKMQKVCMAETRPRYKIAMVVLLLQYAAFFAEMKARRAADVKLANVVSIFLSKPVQTM